MSGAKVWRDHIVPEDRQRALDAELSLLQGERMRCEYRIIGSDGRLIWIREEAEALPCEHGLLTQLQGVMYDITDQKRAEEQLSTALETEREASSRLRALHEMQNSFLQAVSHDLRTPLTTILGSALTLERDNGGLPPEDVKDLLRRIGANARKLHRLLTNLLDLDRMSRGIVEPNRASVDVVDSPPASWRRSRSRDIPWSCRRAPRSTRTLMPDTSSGSSRPRVERGPIHPPGTPIWISIEGSAGGVTIRVDDAGPGVSKELWETIFEPFRQGNEHVEHSPGVGIGLSLVAKFADLHGGWVRCEDRPGAGPDSGSSFQLFWRSRGERNRKRVGGLFSYGRPA